MYSTSSTQMLGKNKKTVELETGIEFPKEEMYSLEIEAEREYVHRLKVQREKVVDWSYRSRHSMPSMTSCLRILRRRTRKFGILKVQRGQCRAYWGAQL
jgi:hypothetical protein